MEDPTQLQYLFDRPRVSHDWLNSLGELQQSGHPENIALAENWRMGHRVSEAHEQALIDSDIFPLPDQQDDFAQCVQDYFAEYLCVSATSSMPPSYLLHHNASNRINKEHISPRQELVHIASLGGLLRVVLNKFPLEMDQLKSDIRRFSGIYPPDPEKLSQQHLNDIAMGLQAKGEQTICEFAAWLSGQLGSTEPHWWAAFALEIDAYMQADDWSQAVRILGLGHLQQGEWLMAWRYAHEWAGPLYRPTVVEAAKHGYHFPSPPEEELGITMPLGTTLPVVKEVVHAPLKGKANAKACMGRLGRVAQALISDHNLQPKQWLAAYRKNHAARLHEHYAAVPVASWLKRHGL